ncbi:MAG TPA: class IV adenylate cyclase [Candidatus Paceibacterota bacterium]
MREIEVKMRVSDHDKLEKVLSERGCVLSEPISQHDVIYSPGRDSYWNDYKEGDVAIRIRNQDGVSMFTLKQQKSGEHDNLEYETVIGDKEAMHGALNALGWSPEVEVKKLRRKGKLGELEICLDVVEELGTFVELEKMCQDDTDPADVEEMLLATLEELGIPRSNQEKRGYDTQMWQKKKENTK